MLEGEMTYNEALIEEREQGITEIAQQIGEVNEIFQARGELSGVASNPLRVFCPPTWVHCMTPSHANNACERCKAWPLFCDRIGPVVQHLLLIHASTAWLKVHAWHLCAWPGTRQRCAGPGRAGQRPGHDAGRHRV